MTLLTPLFLDTPATYSDIPISAPDMRTAYGALRPGVYGAGDLLVTYGGSGLGLSVAAGIGFVQATNADGRYRIQSDDAVASSAFEGGGIATAHATLPRIDQVIAQVYDHTTDASTRREWILKILPGTATSGATLLNRTGAAAVPARALALADVLVPAAATTITSANIVNRPRPARSAYVDVIADVTLASTGSFDFQNIPQGYAALKAVMGSMRGAAAAETTSILFRVNGVTAANSYFYTRMYGTGATVVSDKSDTASAGYVAEQPGATAFGGAVASAELVIPDYANAATVMIASGRGGMRTSATSRFIMLSETQFVSAAPVTSLQVMATGDFAAGSRVTLYGMAGA